MYRPGTGAVLEAPSADEMAEAVSAEVVRLTAVGQPEPIAVVSPLAVASLPAGVFKGDYLPCSDDPDLFFAELPEDVEVAKALCGGCPAQAACLTGAVERREPWGVWGGELFLRGEIVPRKRARGRPRKDEVAA